MVPALQIVCFILALIASVLFTGAAIAVAPISRDSLQKLVENKVRGSSQVYCIIKNKRRFQLMLLTGRILAVVCGSIILYSLVSGHSAVWSVTGTIGRITGFVVATLVFVVSEAVIARLISMGEYDDTVPRFAYFLIVFHVLLYPVTFTLDTVLSLFIEENQEMAAKEEALIELVKSESEAGVIELEEKDMIQGVVEFFDTTVREVMVPRIDMIAVEKNIEINELIALFEKEGHSRIPVYDERIDNILGVIYAKDLLPVITEREKENLSIKDIMRKAYFVHETKKLSDLLAELKKSKVHLAIVVDEYGGTAGIVALEDLLEEIVGDIRDEYDHEERDFYWINDRSVLIDAGLSIDDVNEIIHSDIDDKDYDTLAGFIYHQLGVIPKGGEEFKWETITFTIKLIDGNRISKVLVTLEEPLMKNRQDEE